MIAIKNRIIEPMAENALEQMKYEVSKELGFIPRDLPQNQIKQHYQNSLNKMKYEIAGELGLKPQNGYWGDITSRDCGRVGGRIGGYIGGQMVKRLIEIAEKAISEREY